GRTQLAQAAHYVLYQALRRRGAGGQADALPAGQPFGPNVPGPVDQVGGDAGLGGQLAQAVGIGGIDRTNHQHQVALRGQTAHGALAVLRGIADVVAPWTDDVRKALPQGLDDAARVVYGKRGLGDEGDEGRIAHLDALRVLHRLDELDARTGRIGIVPLPQRALH